ncbi:MAG: mechanosensitive ion channel domain-containing protein [Deltaproteobacteria bacterium]
MADSLALLTAWLRAGSLLLRSRSLGLLVALCAALSLGAAEPAPASAPSSVRLGDDVVFSLSAPHHGRSPAERAKRASEALEQLARATELAEVRVELSADGALIAAGPASIIELGGEDARLAGDANVEAYASKTAESIRSALASEHKRGRIAETVFSFSLVVFFALIALYLIKRVASIAERLRLWIEEHGDRVLAISVKNIELVRPAVLRSSALILLGLLRLVGQFGIFYAWLVVVLSLFETTRGYTERLTGFVLAPLSQLLGRSVTALPLLVVASVAALAVFVLLRFVGLFLASVARRETVLTWLPADLAGPASVLLRAAIVVAALVFGAPIVTGSADGTLGRSGAILLVALGLAATPLFASALLGTLTLFGRRLVVGEYVRVRDRLGRISAINLLELRLETSDRTEQRIPHLLLFGSALERLGLSPRFAVEVLVAGDAPPLLALDALARAGELVGKDAAAELLAVEAGAARYRVSATCGNASGRSALLVACLEALTDAGLRAVHSRDTRATRTGSVRPT